MVFGKTIYMYILLIDIVKCDKTLEIHSLQQKVLMDLRLKCLALLEDSTHGIHQSPLQAPSII